MKWKEKTPTKEGYYWYKTYDNWPPSIPTIAVVYIDDEGYINSIGSGVRIRPDGDEMWSGRIKEPVDKKRKRSD